MLQLVISKGMKPAEILIAQVKRLIDFFLRSKQSERLKEIQAKFPELADELKSKTKETNNEKDDDDYNDNYYNNNENYNNKNNDEENDDNEESDNNEENKEEEGDNEKDDDDYDDNNKDDEIISILHNQLKKHIIMLLNTLNSKNDRESKKDYKNLQKIMLSDDEWNTIKKLVKVLRPFAETTELLGGSTYCTNSMIIPILIDIKNKLLSKSQKSQKSHQSIDATVILDFSNDESAFDEYILNEDLIEHAEQSYVNNPINCDGLVNKIKIVLYSAINHYWKNIIKPQALLSSLLDPYIKNLPFVLATE
ncbi:hypothetical protein C1645_837986 [Glomus cerebriforme]|uniref:Uncharacterized protein n=1 Tax=Glomus cerebriforme TaxID=658196 RepID=A0A397S342_9GLOM|nr:hypothetical protein C1645_837986 [Glomus cerebriforme]